MTTEVLTDQGVFEQYCIEIQPEVTFVELSSQLYIDLTTDLI